MSGADSFATIRSVLECILLIPFNVMFGLIAEWERQFLLRKKTEIIKVDVIM